MDGLEGYSGILVIGMSGCHEIIIKRACILILFLLASSWYRFLNIRTAVRPSDDVCRSDGDSMRGLCYKKKTFYRETTP